MYVLQQVVSALLGGVLELVGVLKDPFDYATALAVNRVLALVAINTSDIPLWEIVAGTCIWCRLQAKGVVAGFDKLPRVAQRRLESLPMWLSFPLALVLAPFPGGSIVTAAILAGWPNRRRALWVCTCISSVAVLATLYLAHGAIPNTSALQEHILMGVRALAIGWVIWWLAGQYKHTYLYVVCLKARRRRRIAQMQRSVLALVRQGYDYACTTRTVAAIYWAASNVKTRHANFRERISTATAV